MFSLLACFRLIISLIAELLVGCAWEDLAVSYELGKHWHGTSNMSALQTLALFMHTRHGRETASPLTAICFKDAFHMLFSQLSAVWGLCIAWLSFWNVLNMGVKEHFLCVPYVW